MAEQKSKSENDDGTPLLEWIFGAIGLVLFVAALVVTILNGMNDPRPPEITIRAANPQQVGGRFRVEFEAANTGDETAEQIQVRADLKRGDQVIESHDLTIYFLSAHSTSEAGVFFDENPQGATIDIRAHGYQKP